MATVTDVEVANASFPTVRQDLNDILEAIATNFSADAEPTTTYPNQWWYETDTNKLYIRNEANDAWIHVLTLDQTTDVVSSVEGVSADKIEEGNSSVEVIDTGTGYIQINVDGSEAGRFDSSGNLLVGKTASDVSTEGVELRPDLLVAVRDNGNPAYFRRNSSDGEIVNFIKDGTKVGSIGTTGGRIGIGTGDCGVYYNETLDAIIPANPSTTFSNRDAAISFGVSGVRFKDLYLSGGVYLGGTGAANYLDDYEEGTHTVTLSAGSGTPTISSAEDSLAYTVIGDNVFINGALGTINCSGCSGALFVTMPFVAKPNSDRADYYFMNVISGISSIAHFYLLQFNGGSATFQVNAKKTDGTIDSSVASLLSSAGNFDLYIVGGTYKKS